MILIAIIALFACTSFYLNLPIKLTELALASHHFCLQILPTSVENLSSLEALVCGKNMQPSAEKQILVHTSLIHVFVVSGSHFLLLHKIFAKILNRRFFAIVPLGFYALATLCQPPAVRSLFYLSLAEVSREKKLFTPPLLLVLLSGLFSLALFPSWIYSRSLLMSLFASLALSISSEILYKDSRHSTRLLLSQVFIYIALAFCLWGTSSLHPLSIVLNLTLGPIIGTVLFPLGLLVTFVPFLVPLFDRSIDFLFFVLMKSKELFNMEPSAFSLSHLLLWLLFLATLLVVHIFSIQRKRSSYER